MRIGQNPAKFVKEVVKPARITVAVLNYIPFMSGFYAEALDVLKVCLDSLRQNSDLPFDLLVFDNASCDEARQYLVDLHQQGGIQYLLLSDRNLGKGGAWNMILAGSPGEIIVYTDSDAFFYPGWLSRSVQILETYPRVGMVTARPYRTKEEYCTSTFAWAESEPGVHIEQGQLISYATIREFDLSLGQGEDEIRQRYETTRDTRLTYQGVQAVVGASHWQFSAYKTVLQQFLPFAMDRPMGQVRQLDQRMNEAGYLRLMVSDPLAMNMSNTLRGTLHHSLQGANTSSRSTGVKKALKGKALLDFPPVKKSLLALYDSIFRWYYDR